MMCKQAHLTMSILPNVERVEVCRRSGACNGQGKEQHNAQRLDPTSEMNAMFHCFYNLSAPAAEFAQDLEAGRLSPVSQTQRVYQD